MNRMELHSKYLTGFLIIGALCVAYFFLIPVAQIPFGLFDNPLDLILFYGYSPVNIGVILLGIGIIISTIGLVFYYLLYSSERIKGFKAEYEISPDLTQFKIIPYSKNESSIKNEEIPDKAFCSHCGKEIFQPFRCNLCRQLLCGKHYLPGEHSCKEDGQ